MDTFAAIADERRALAGLLSDLDGLHLEASDIDWAHGRGMGVEGPAEALLLVLTGRRAGLEALTGDGLPTLRARLS